MTESPPRSLRTVLPWIILGITIAGISLAFVISQTRQKRAAEFPVISQLAPFQLTNQIGQLVTLDNLKGKVWVADIIFTRCPVSCRELTRKMHSLQDVLGKNSRVQLISITTDPEFDTPAILKKYADEFGAETGRWQFLTSTREQIYQVAVEGLKLVLVEKKPHEVIIPNDLFLHSLSFVVVDKNGQIRAHIDSTDTNYLARVNSVVKALL